MPIEIKELHIRINVDNNSEANTPETTTDDSAQVNRIVETCVEQVMELLSKKEER